ncbi:MAG: hypothetical protein E6G94_01265 [Alphaproteobacteria bacterium]|nr:MAG: hypothetical protein E6G94_01265 [Alphaproteobacteria bacterium]
MTAPGIHSCSLSFAELEVRRTRLRAHRAIAHLDAMKQAGIPPTLRLAHSHVEQSVAAFRAALNKRNFEIHQLT